MAVNAHELIYGRDDRLKVFVSSKMAGRALESERAAAVEHIERFPSMRAWAWERDAVAGSFYSEEECVGQAATSDALVLILEDDLTDITRKEYLAAKRNGTHRIILHRTGAKRSKALQRFIDRERTSGAVTAGYGNNSELSTRLFEALRELSVRPARERMVRLREAARQASRAYDDLDICVGEDDDLKPLSAAVADARELVNVDEAFDVMYDFVEQALSVGLIGVAVHLIEDLRDLVPASEIDDEREGWVLNLEGRALSAAGDHQGARSRLDRMRQLGRSRDDLDMESTALQNLGVQAVLTQNYDDAARLFRESLIQKDKLGDVYGGVQVLLNQINVLAGQGKLDKAEALLDDLDEVIREARDPDLRTSVLGHRAQLLITAGEFDSARPFLLDSVRVARRKGLPDRELTGLRNLARLDQDRGAHRQSLTWARKALEVAQSLGDRVQEELVRRALAVALHTCGRLDEAVLQFVAAAELAEELGDTYANAESLNNAAVCLTEVGRADDAIRMLDAVLASSAETEDEFRSRQLGNLALAYDAAGDAEKSVGLLERAAKLAPDWEDAAGFLRRAALIALSDVRSAPKAPEFLEGELVLRRANQSGGDWAWAAAEMGATLLHTSQAGRARDFFSAALRVFAAKSDLQRSFSIRNDRALAAAEIGDLHAARADLDRSLGVARRLKDRALESQALMNLSEIDRRAGDDASAREHARQGLRLARATEDHEEEASALVQIGLIEIDQDDLIAAERTLKEGLRIARTTSDTRTVCLAHKHLAHLHFLRGRFARSAQAYRRAVALAGDEPSSSRVEALGGVIVADAHRGLIEETLIQPFVDTSQALGWERNAADELFGAAHQLLLHRRPSSAAELLVVSTLMELRSVGEGSNTDEIISRLAQLIALAGSTRQPGFVRKLREEFRRHTSSDDLVSLIDDIVDVGREARREMRSARR